MPRITRIAPGISVPMIRPLEASLAIASIPRAETNTPAQNTATMTTPV